MVSMGTMRYYNAWKNPPHSHDYVEIIYVVKGELTVTVEETNYDAHEGDLIVFNKGALHHESTTNDTALLTLQSMAVTDIQINSLPPGHLIGDSSPHIHTNDFRFTIETYFNDILLSATQLDIDMIQQSQKKLRTLLEMILQLSNNNAALQNTPYITQECKKVKEYIDINFKQPIDLKELSSLIHISKDYLSHAFKQYCGMSPINYLIQCRINDAKRLLSETNFNVAMISQMVGYDNPVYFSQIFKKTTGLSPSEYRDRTK